MNSPDKLINDGGRDMRYCKCPHPCNVYNNVCGACLMVVSPLNVLGHLTDDMLEDDYSRGYKLGRAVGVAEVLKLLESVDAIGEPDIESPSEWAAWLRKELGEKSTSKLKR